MGNFSAPASTPQKAQAWRLIARAIANPSLRNNDPTGENRGKLLLEMQAWFSTARVYTELAPLAALAQRQREAKLRKIGRDVEQSLKTLPVPEDLVSTA